MSDDATELVDVAFEMDVERVRGCGKLAALATARLDVLGVALDTVPRRRDTSEKAEHTAAALRHVAADAAQKPAHAPAAPVGAG